LAAWAGAGTGLRVVPQGWTIANPALNFAVNEFNSMRILIIEDHPLMYEGLRAVLHRHFPAATVDRADTLKGAREQVRRGKWDVVLLDIGLPDGDGLDLLEDLEKSAPWC
jgi:DNA-binding NtrC family response regulator